MYCISCFRCAIKKLPPDKKVFNPRVWYQTQRGHWIGWLSTLSDRGDIRWRNAQHVYEAIRCCPMLLWLGEAVGLKSIHRRAKRAYEKSSFREQPFAIRAELRWSLVEKRLFEGVRLKKCGVKFCKNYRGQ